MPQRKLIYGSLILSSVLLLLIARLVVSIPTSFLEQVQERSEKSRDKRSFYDIHCKGIYDKSIFARIDQICEDCYNLFREPKLHSVCRQDCFTTEYFKGCVEVLLLNDEFEKYQEWIRRLNGLGVY
ncbi:ion transport peptide-like isoform X1 [Planococcus citri]|uniref:ion transport peptide-like isoform X1 n=1 Tax=Planococcus citri TaxID=170843 RepID=UPI0031F80EBC